MLNIYTTSSSPIATANARELMTVEVDVFLNGERRSVNVR